MDGLFHNKPNYRHPARHSTSKIFDSVVLGEAVRYTRCYIFPLVVLALHAAKISLPSRLMGCCIATYNTIRTGSRILELHREVALLET